MQNKYVGDIGDYCKLGLLRWLAGVHHDSSGKKLSLGVGWYAVPDDFDPPKNRDGRHVEYLGLEHSEGGRVIARPASAQLCHLDFPLWDALRAQVIAGNRCIAALECILRQDIPACSFHSTPLPSTPGEGSWVQKRGRWFEGLLKSLADTPKPDLLFVDPDNGLATENMGPSSRSLAKHVQLPEIIELANRHCEAGFLFYHHLGQHAPHEAQIESLKRRLLESFEAEWNISSLIFNRYSCRAFVLLSRRGDSRGKLLDCRFSSFIQKWKRPDGAVAIP